MVLLLLLELLMMGEQGLVEKQKVLAGQATKVGMSGARRKSRDQSQRTRRKSAEQRTRLT